MVEGEEFSDFKLFFLAGPKDRPRRGQGNIQLGLSFVPNDTYRPKIFYCGISIRSVRSDLRDRMVRRGGQLSLVVFSVHFMRIRSNEKKLDYKPLRLAARSSSLLPITSGTSKLMFINGLWISPTHLACGAPQ